MPTSPMPNQILIPSSWHQPSAFFTPCYTRSNTVVIGPLQEGIIGTWTDYSPRDAGGTAERTVGRWHDYLRGDQPKHAQVSPHIQDLITLEYVPPEK
ncbi:hypothetical protein VTN77DRAFT_6780 [Rasamsonia byssochlamydoides]|uniref:uncharacterized protein n=1 Tax=Rasamsonia byssochlamydoides TaxID=89139 RepID=UPI0037446F69